MGISRKKPDSEADPAVVASPATPIENEKQVIGSKKLKIDNGNKEKDFEENNFGKETEENTEKEQNNSSEENKVEVSEAINSEETTQDANRANISNEHEEEDKDDNSKENHHLLETPTKSAEVSPVIKSAETTTQDANRDTVTNEYEKEEDNSNEDQQHLETPMESVEVPPDIKSTQIARDTKRARISNDCEEQDKDDESNEDHNHLETPTRSVDVPPAVKSSPTTQDAKRARISNKSEEDRDDHSNENHHLLETSTKSVEVTPAIKSAETTQDANKATISSEYEEEHSDDNSKKSGTDAEMLDDAPSLKKTAQTPESKTVHMDNLSFSIQEKDVKKFFKNVGEIAEIHFDMKEDYFTGQGHVEFTTSEAAQEALKLSNTLLLDRPVKLNLAAERGEHLSTAPHATSSKTLYLGNLSYQIEEDDVKEFFKDVGEIAAIRFAIKNDRFLGHGYVEFNTAEAAQEALKLNREMILERKVKLDFARERGVYSPGSSFEKSNQRVEHAQGGTIYVRGFDCSHGFENIRSRLEKHFGKCGEISRINVPKDHESGGPRGVAFIDFTDGNAFSQALRLDKSEIGGFKIIVEEAKNKRRDAREGSGYGGGGGWGRDGGSGGGESGSSSGWGRGHDYGGGGGSGRATGGFGRGNDYGGGSGRVSGGWGREDGWHGGGGWGRGNNYGGGSGGGLGGASGGSGGGWRREGGWHGDGGWRGEGGSTSRGNLGRGSGYGGEWAGGGGFSSSYVGRYSGYHGGNRGGGGGRP